MQHNYTVQIQAATSEEANLKVSSPLDGVTPLVVSASDKLLPQLSGEYHLHYVCPGAGPDFLWPINYKNIKSQIDNRHYK